MHVQRARTVRAQTSAIHGVRRIHEGIHERNLPGHLFLNHHFLFEELTLRSEVVRWRSGVDDPYLKRVHVEAKVGEWVPPNRFGEIINEPEKSGDEHKNPLFHPKCRSHSDFCTIRTSTRLKGTFFSDVWE